MKIFNNIISIFVIVIVALLIVPLSTPILDFMFIMNFLAAWFGGMTVKEIPREELTRVLNNFFGGRK